jgi:hypothetical protein
VAKVYEVDENDLWLEMELAKKLTPNRFKEIVGLKVEQVGHYLIVKDVEDNGRKSSWMKLDDELRNLGDNNEWLQRVYTLCREVDLAPADFNRISSFGEVVRDNKPAVVIIDMGFNKTVAHDFYGVT